MPLPSQARVQIVHAIEKHVRSKFVNLAGVDLDQWSQAIHSQLAEAIEAPVQVFEDVVRGALSGLKSSHTGFFHGFQNRLLPQHSINATLVKCVRANGRWVFNDVFPEGPADRGGIQSGDVLLALNGVPVQLDSTPHFQMGHTHKLSLTDVEGVHMREVAIEVPLRKGTKQRPPIVEPKAVTSELLTQHVGILRIPYFSGTAGMRFGQELAHVITGLTEKGADRLIIDLRGNIGGSLGFAVLASHLCSDVRPIGYSVTPQALNKGYNKGTLPKVRMPKNRMELLLTLGSYAFRDKSVVLMTQGLGRQAFHGRIAILVNEFTHSAGEMVASFAAENRLAVLVGTNTPGNVLGAVNLAVGYEYFVRLPVFGWFTSNGTCLEKRGVTPDLVIERDGENCGSKDEQLKAALRAIA